MSVFSCHQGKFFPVTEECSSCWTSFSKQPFFCSHSSWTLLLDVSSIPSGVAFSCLLVEGDVEIEFHQCLGQWLMFLLFLGMFGGFGVNIPAHCLHTHSLPPLTAASLTQSRGYTWYQNTPDSEYPRSRMA